MKSKTLFMCRLADNKDFLHYFLNEMPNVDLTQLPTYSKYTDDMWEWILLES